MALAELRRGLRDKFLGRQIPVVPVRETTGERTPERQFVDVIDSALYALKQRDPQRQTFRSMHYNRIDFGHRDVEGRMEHYFMEAVNKDENGNLMVPVVEIYVTRKGVLSHSRGSFLKGNRLVQLPDGNQADVEKISAKLKTIVQQ